MKKIVYLSLRATVSSHTKATKIMGNFGKKKKKKKHNYPVSRGQAKRAGVKQIGERDQFGFGKKEERKIEQL